MKNILLVLSILITHSLSAQEEIHIPDTNFLNALIAQADLNSDGMISRSEALKVDSLSLINKGITDLKGIEAFLNLKYLLCAQNNLSALDVRPLTKLEELYCQANDLTTLKVDGLTNLKVFICSDNNLQELNLSGLNNLERLICSVNPLTSLDVRHMKYLKDLECSQAKLKSIDVTGLISLERFSCFGNDISHMELSDLPNLETLLCSGNNMKTLQLYNLAALNFILCYDNDLTILDLRNMGSLTSVNFSGNTNLKVLDIRHSSNLMNVIGTDTHLECIVADEAIVASGGGDINWKDINNLAGLLTTTPCLGTFDGIRDLVDNMFLPQFTESVLNSSLELAEETCSIGSKHTAISLLYTMSFMVDRLRQTGKLTALQASQLQESTNLLIDDIRYGRVDCSNDNPWNIWEWIASWFMLEGEGNAGTIQSLDPNSQAIVRKSWNRDPVQLYPNPTSGRLNLSQPASKVILLSVMGQEISRHQNTENVDLSDCRPGIYVVRLYDGVSWSNHKVIRQ